MTRERGKFIYGQIGMTTFKINCSTEFFYSVIKTTSKYFSWILTTPSNVFVCQKEREREGFAGEPDKTD